MANEKQDKAKKVIEAGIAQHMAQVPRFGSQSRIIVGGVKSNRPNGAPRPGVVVDAMKLTPRGLEVRFGNETVIVGQGSWTYVVEVDE